MKPAFKPCWKLPLKKYQLCYFYDISMVDWNLIESNRQVVEIHVNEYDYLQSTVDLDFVDFGDAEVKSISEVAFLKEIIWI